MRKKNKHHKYIWMKVSNDKYELPVAVADTAEELALACGVSANSIYADIWRFEKGHFSSSVYYKVLNEGGDVE